MQLAKYGSNITWTAIGTAVETVSRYYTIPDAGASAEFVMTAGDQAIGGTKAYSRSI